MYLLPAPTAPLMPPALTPSTRARSAVLCHMLTDRATAAREAEASTHRAAQVKAWHERSQRAALPTPHRNPHNGVFRLYIAPLTLTAPDDSFGGHYPLSDKMPDKLPTKIGLTSVRRIGHEVKPKVAVKGERWWERGSEFPMGDTAKIAKEYAANR